MATQNKFTADLGIKTDADLQVDGSVTITGDLTVNGTQTTVNSTTTSVTDSLFELANSNTGSDTLDIGIYGNYDDGLSDSGASEYTGLFRDASDSTWKLFDGLEEEPSSTINTSGTGYTLADLQVGDLTATTLTATNSLTGSSITYPTTDGTNGQVLTTDGSGTLSFSDVSGGISNIVEDTTPQLGGDLDLNSNNITGTGDINVTGTVTTIDKVGIGTSSPETFLHIKTTSPTISMTDTNSFADTNDRFQIRANADVGQFQWYDDSASSTTTLMTLTPSGNVGIGTNDPATKLDVNGAIRLTDATYSIYSSSASAVIGHIGNTANDLNIYSSTAGHNGLRFHVNGILPTDNTGTIVDADANLGESSYRFKDLYLSGQALVQSGATTAPSFAFTNDPDTGISRPTSDAVNIVTAGIERMRIHSGGQITASYQPCFMCYPTSSFTASGGSVKYTFASEAFDNQNEYNHTTGRFTAPIAGKYLFMAELALDSSVSALTYAGIGVRVNGSGSVYFGGWGYKADGYSNSSGAHYGKANSSVILNLAQGDYIELYIELSGSHTVLGGNGGTYTRLMGHLLTA